MTPCESYTNTVNLSLLSKTTEINKTDNNSLELKKEYIKNLLPVECRESWVLSPPLEGLLCELSVEKLQALYLSLHDVLTEKCSYSERALIITSLLKVDQREWDVLLQQVCFIMPLGTRGHDVGWAIEILSLVKNSAYRAQLIHAANRLFKYDTGTTERGYILKSLAELDSEKLSAI